MSRSPWLCMSVVILSACAFGQSRSQVVHEGEHAGASDAAFKRISLCEALSSTAPGELHAIVVTGIYTNQHTFYDPAEPTCRRDVQPSTWVELAVPKKQRRELDRLVTKDNRAAVTFRGRLFGPAALKPDSPVLPPPFAYMERIAHRRYGHQNWFRTTLIVDGIDSVAPVSASVPWEESWHRQVSPSLRVLTGQIPSYPWQARFAGVSGEVHLEVTVEKGAVSAVNVISGDRLLLGSAQGMTADGAIAVAQSWQFDPTLSTTFTSVFQYELESRDTGSSDLERVEMELPTRVRIIAPRDDW